MSQPLRGRLVPDETRPDPPSIPSGIADHAKQLRPPIVRGEGVTDAERYLANLGDRSFLNLWSYSSPHRDQRDHPGATQGKEICDLLVVCAPHIIIVSEKTLAWQADRPLNVAWPRWFRGAVWESVKQIRGAERWITEHPDRIFTDRECTTRLPLALPPVGERIIHRVVVAQGVSDAVRVHFGGGSGSLVIKPAIVGDRHFNTHIHGNAVEPFAIGDIDPNEPFVHVLDEASLDIVMGELDTITDFTAYLQKKEAFIRAGRLDVAHGEENLLAYYAVRTNEDEDHDFTHPSGGPWPAGEAIEIAKDTYDRFTANPQYVLKKRADRDSYIWDRLIGAFTKPLIDGTSLVPKGYEFDLQKSEVGLRYMALERRLNRRNHGKHVLEAMETGRGKDVFFRAMMATETSRENDVGFFFMTLKYPAWLDAKGGYERYREVRSFYLTTYAKAMLMQQGYLQRIVGIGTEPPGGKRGGSEDMIYAEQHDWTEEDRAAIKADCEKLGIMRPTMKAKHFHAQEFPDAEGMHIVMPSGETITLLDDDDPFAAMAEMMNASARPTGPVNRQQRRAAEREARKRKR